MKITKSKKGRIVKNINESLSDLGNSVYSKEIPENENANKIINFVGKNFDFNKQQKYRGLKI